MFSTPSIKYKLLDYWHKVLIDMNTIFILLT